jgi:hypothetical protein
MKRAGLSVLGMIALISASHAGEGRTFFGLTFPETIEGAKYDGFIDNEAEHPGLGYTVAYRHPQWNISVYIYDLGLSAVPNDTESGPMYDNFQDSKAAISRRGLQVELRREFVASRGSGPKFLCASYTVMAPGPRESLLCLTSWKNKLLKFRVTGARTETSDIEAQTLVAAWSKVLAPN